MQAWFYILHIYCFVTSHQSVTEMTIEQRRVAAQSTTPINNPPAKTLLSSITVGFYCISQPVGMKYICIPLKWTRI